MSQSRQKRFEKVDLCIDGKIKTNSIYVIDNNGESSDLLKIINDTSDENVQKINTVDERLTDEIDNRTSADNNINGRIDSVNSAITKEIGDRESAINGVVETIEYVTGVPFEKPEATTKTISYGWEETGKNQSGNCAGFDTVISQDGYLSSISIGCRYASGGSIGEDEDMWIIIWKKNNGTYEYLGTSKESQRHKIGGNLVYTFDHNSIPVSSGDKIRISFHDESQINTMKNNNVYNFSTSTCSYGCLRVNSNRLDENFIYFTTDGGAYNYVVAHTMTIALPSSSLNELIMSLMEEITQLKSRVTALESSN